VVYYDLPRMKQDIEYWEGDRKFFAAAVNNPATPSASSGAHAGRPQRAVLPPLASRLSVYRRRIRWFLQPYFTVFASY